MRYLNNLTMSYFVLSGAVRSLRGVVEGLARTTSPSAAAILKSGCSSGALDCFHPGA
jgi:hypothetical protein